MNRHKDFTEPLPLRVAMGTYNINGGKHFRSIVYKNVSLSDWIYAHKQNGKKSRVEIFSTCRGRFPHPPLMHFVFLISVSWRVSPFASRLFVSVEIFKHFQDCAN